PGVVHGVGGVVGEARLTGDRTARQALSQRGSGQLVVDPPAHVVGTGPAAVRPPGVLHGIGLERAEGVHPAVVGLRGAVAAVVGDLAVEPGALGGQAAGVLLVGGPVLDVVARAHDVPVAAQHVVAAAGQPLVQDRFEPVHDLELEALAQLPGGSGGDIERHHRQVAEARLDVAPLVVERIPAQAGAQFIGLAAAVDRHAAVALLGGRVAEGDVVAGGPERLARELVLLGLGFLDAQDVGVLFGEPVEKSLVGRRTDAVGVEADDAHAGQEKRTARKGYLTAPSCSQPRGRPPAVSAPDAACRGCSAAGSGTPPPAGAR